MLIADILCSRPTTDLAYSALHNPNPNSALTLIVDIFGYKRHTG